MTLEIGSKAPDFKAQTDGKGTLQLSDLKGQNVILYFYPKDDTPGCTKESCEFRDALPDFSKVNAVILGVSKDSVQKHDKFKSKYDLPFTLISDEDGTVCEAYGTWLEKINFGKKYMGIERTTYLIDETGTIRNIWRKVKVKGHVDSVLAEVQNLEQEAA